MPLFGEHAGRTADQVQERERRAVWEQCLCGYRDELRERPPVEWARTETGRREIALKDCRRFAAGLRRALGLDLAAVVAAALRYKRAHDAHRDACARHMAARGRTDPMALACREERDALFAAHDALLAALEVTR